MSRVSVDNMQFASYHSCLRYVLWSTPATSCDQPTVTSCDLARLRARSQS